MNREIATAAVVRHHRRVARTGHCGAARQPASGRLGCAGDQDRAAGQGRFLPRLRLRHERDVEPVRLDQPFEGKSRARCQKRRGPARARRAAAAGGRVSAKSRTRRGQAPRPRCRDAGGALSPPDRLRHFRLRQRRSLWREESLRPAGAVRGGISVDQRHAGAAGEMRHRRRRYRDRHVHRQRRADGAVQPRAHRQGHGVRGLAVRFHDRMDELSRLLHRWRRQAAGPHRHASRHHRALRPVPMRRRAGGVLRHSERARMDRALRAGAGGRGAGQSIRAFATIRSACKIAMRWRR